MIRKLIRGYLQLFHKLAGQLAITCECRHARVSAGTGLHSPPLLVPNNLAMDLASLEHLAKPSVTIGIHSGVLDRSLVKYR